MAGFHHIVGPGRLPFFVFRRQTLSGGPWGSEGRPGSPIFHVLTFKVGPFMWTWHFQIGTWPELAMPMSQEEIAHLRAIDENPDIV